MRAVAPAAAAGKRLESSEPASVGEGREAILLALQDEDALLPLLEGELPLLEGEIHGLGWKVAQAGAAGGWRDHCRA